MREAFLTTERIDEAGLTQKVSIAHAGAVATFAGLVRDHNKGRKVLHLEYEAYDEMALGTMQTIVEQAAEQFPIDTIVISHRTGRLEIGETSVFIAVGSAHRPAAFDACRFAIDEIKREVPIWKKEFFEGGEVWIEGPGDCEHSHD